MSDGLSSGKRSPLGRKIHRLLDEGVFYCFYFVGQALIRIFYRLHSENLPSFRGDRPVILAPNHTSFLDPIILQAAVPRRITYLMTETYYRIGLIRWWFRRMGCIAIPVKGSQLAAIRLGIEALRTRGMVTIFPEGRRSPDGELKKGYPGVATLARKTGALVVPVAIFGTFEALPRGARFLRPARMTVRFGAPLDFSTGGHRDNVEITGLIMDSIRALQSA